MPAPIHVAIPEPCHENWQQMTPNEQGRHCMSCQKTVVDFTFMSDQEILDHISRASSSVCGRFNNDQLNKTYAEKKIKPSFTFRYAWNMITAAFLLTGSAATAQVKKTLKKKTAVKSTWEFKLETGQQFTTLGFVASAQEPSRFIEPRLKMYGLIRDNSTRKPISAASVRLKGVKAGVEAGKDGRFEFPIIDISGKVTLEVTAKGYVTQDYTVDVNSFHTMEFFLTPEAALEPKEDILGAMIGKVAVKKEEQKQPEPEYILGAVAILKPDIAQSAVQKISGVIIDDSTSKPVSFASVRIKGHKSGIAADEAGRFSITVPAKKRKLTLVVSGVGYDPNEFEVMAGENKSYRVMLPPAADNLEPVMITGFPPISCGRGHYSPLIQKDELPVSTDSLVNVAVAGGISVRREVTVTEKIKRGINKWLPTKKEVRIYPNPVAPGNQLNVKLDLKNTGEYKLELMDAAGRVVYIQALQVAQPSQVANVPTQSSWSRGVYWVRLSNATDKKVYQAKVLLQ